MENAMKVVKLDWLKIKPYRKQMLTFYGIITVLMVATLPEALNVIYFVYASSFVNYSYMSEEQNKMKQFDSILGISRKGRVRGKYIGVLLYLAATLLLVAVVNSMFYQVKLEEVNVLTLWLTVAIGMMMYFVMVSIQTPLSLRWGYSKTKYMNMILPLGIGVGVPTLVGGISSFVAEEQIMSYSLSIEYFVMRYINHIFIGVIGIGAFSLFISYRIALRMYDSV